MIRNGTVRETTEAWMYEHAIAAFALADACAAAVAESRDADPQFLAATEGAVRFIEAIQHNDGGWRYKTIVEEVSDPSVSEWPMFALRSAAAAGIAVAPETNSRLIDFFKSRLAADGRTGYLGRGPSSLALQSGLGKSHLIQGVGRVACSLGYRVRYATSADLLADLVASLADRSLPQRLRYWSNFELLILDEFGFDKIERSESAQAASLLYKLVDSRGPKRSTALVTNVDFEAWAEYLGDAPLAMAILDRLVDGAIVLKISGRSYRARRRSSSASERFASPVRFPSCCRGKPSWLTSSRC